MNKEQFSMFNKNLKKDFCLCLGKEGLKKKDANIAFQICKEIFKEYSLNRYEAIFCIAKNNSDHSFKLFKIPLFEIGIEEYTPDLSEVHRYIEENNEKVFYIDLLGFYLNIKKKFNISMYSPTLLLNNEESYI